MKLLRCAVVTASMLVCLPVAAQTAPMAPAQAIAAATASGQVEGVFEFTVVSTGASGFNIYLNSAADYRDPANLSVELHAGAAQALRKQLGGEPEDLMKGKRIRVKGIARHVPIPRRDGTTYYQTRIDADTGDQVQLIG